MGRFSVRPCALSLDHLGAAVSVRRRQSQPVTPCEPAHVLEVMRSRFVAKVMGELELRGEARNLFTVDHPDREPFGRVFAVRAVRRRPCLPARAVGVEGDRVQVHLPPEGVAQHDTVGRWSSTTP